MLDVLLINPVLSYSTSLYDLDDVFAHHPPLGYLYLAAALQEKGFKVDVIDTSTNYSLKALVTVIKRKKPKIVGLSAVTASMRGAYQLASEIKKKVRPKPVIILGGHHVSCDPGVVGRYACFDYGITGEAEITLPLVVDKIVNQKRKMVKNKVLAGKIPCNLDKLPVPARDLIDYKKLKSRLVISLLSSRGCPYNCIFCSRPAVSKVVRYRAPKLVVEEMIDMFKKTGSTEFVFQDDTFNMDSGHVIGICEEIIRSGYKFCWTAYGRFNLLNERMVKKMAEAGCKNLLFGVESGNERIRNKVIKKAITDKQIRRGIALCWKYDIEPDVFLMLGFPTETKKELYDTVNFGKKFLPNMLGVHITCVFPGSYLWNDLVKKGKIKVEIIDDYIQGKLGEEFSELWPKYIPDGLTVDDLLTARALAHRTFYLSPKYILKRLSRDLTSFKSLKEDVRQAYSIFRYGRSFAKRKSW